MCYKHICEVSGQDGRDRIFGKATDLIKQGGLTLDGKPAMIRGRLLTFPVISQQACPFLQIPFAWATIAHVLDHGGHFNS
jgi:hypothetical protein